MAKELTGTCAFCGQTKIVEAESQEEANRMAAEECTCDNNYKKARQCADNIDMICGQNATEYGMEMVTEEVTEALKEIGRLCIYGHITAATVRVTDSTINIKQIKDGVAVSRKKVSSVKLEA